MAKQPFSFRLLTYNIHKGIGGVDRRYRPERIIETIKHCEPEIVFLQEVDDGVPRSRRDRQVDLLGDALGFKYRAFQQNVKLRQGHYGNAILSRYPLYDVQDLDLTISLKKRRRAIACHCRVTQNGHTRQLVLINTHLGLARFERNIQIRRILDCEFLEHTRPDSPIILGGDFNDAWRRLGRSHLNPNGYQSATRVAKTFPAAFPVSALDYIYYRGDLELDHSFASHTKIAKQASDHLPLVAQFDMY